MNNIIILAENAPVNMVDGFVVMCMAVVTGIFVIGFLAKWIR
jgi:hypothetical protein